MLYMFRTSHILAME